MFGSKIRSWMENHIVRPRKKGNKNKNSSNNIGLGESDIFQKEPNAYKTTVTDYLPIIPDDQNAKNVISSNNVYGSALHLIHNHNVCSNSVQSPVRRREVSPIESHTTSRFGWQSPHKEETLSSKSDHLSYIQNKSIKENNFTASLHSYGSQNTPRNHVKQKTTCVMAKIPQRNSSSAPSLSGSSVTFNKSQRQENLSKNPNPYNIRSNLTEWQRRPSNDAAMTTESKLQLLNSLLSESQQRKHEKFESERRNHFEKVLDNTKNNSYIQREYESQDYNLYNSNFSPETSARYGKILPSKFQPEDYQCSLKTTVENNNNNDCHHRFYDATHSSPVSIKKMSVCYDTYGKAPPVTATGCSARNMLRTSRYSGTGGLVSATANNCNVNGGSAHIINSLSSPESAYSTGYSTDGTSPSAATCTPPEYYVNIRTGTHYFPKSVNTLAIEAQRYKFGLNKIEEMSPQDPMPPLVSVHQRCKESFDCGDNKICDYSTPEADIYRNRFDCKKHENEISNNNVYRNVISKVNGFESPSPRQRCRIRTNPWYSTGETSSSAGGSQKNCLIQKMPNNVEIDATSSSSSGIKTYSSESWLENNKQNKKLSEESSGSSSSTEIEDIPFSANTIKRKKTELPCRTLESQAVTCSAINQCLETVSDEDITLNEMLGKFDESYIYEKETDILSSSDSDRTDYLSDFDTGQDAGDECDTDDMLDIDFIDTISIHECVDRSKERRDFLKKTPSNINGQEIGPLQNIVTNPQTVHFKNKNFSNHKSTVVESSSGYTGNCAQRKRKRLMKTRKKNSDYREYSSPIQRCHESRSLGGTPICLRRHYLTPALSYRSSSLTFTELHSIREHFVKVSESEKALLRADLEADIKYRQLIHEAETILLSMKTSALSISNVNAIESPRRSIPLANKRVEMLKNYELDVKRDMIKQNQKRLNAIELENIEMSKYGLFAEEQFCGKGVLESPRKILTNQYADDIKTIRIAKKPESPEKTPKLIRTIKNDFLSGPLTKEQSNFSIVRPRTQNQIYKNDLICSETDSDEKYYPSEIEQKGTTKNSMKKLRSYLAQSKKSCTFKKTACTNARISECPQSEPLKRKIYSVTKQSSYENSNELNFEKNKSRTANIKQNLGNSMSDKFEKFVTENGINGSLSNKQQLILNTIEDLKKNLENQSVELNDLNGNEQT